MKRVLPFLVILMMVGTGFWVWYEETYNHTPLYSGFIEAEDVSLGSKVGGRVVAVRVQEGDTVHAGDPLIQLDTDTLTARVQSAQAQLEQAQKRLAELENGSRPEEIQQAQALYESARQNWLLLKNGPRQEDILAARANLAAASADLQLAAIVEKRQQELFKTKDTSADTLDRAQKETVVARNRYRASDAALAELLAGFRSEEILAAEAQMESASASWVLVQRGPRWEQIDQARADAEHAQASLLSARVDLRESTIAAPSEGVVETSRLQPGDLLAPNQTALTMILFIPMWLRIYVPESRLGDVPVGKELDFTVASFPGKLFHGRIVQVNRKAEYTPRNVQSPETRDDLVFGVKIDIHDPEQLLRPGMVADVHLSRQTS